MPREERLQCWIPNSWQRPKTGNATRMDLATMVRGKGSSECQCRQCVLRRLIVSVGGMGVPPSAPWSAKQGQLTRTPYCGPWKHPSEPTLSHAWPCVCCSHSFAILSFLIRRKTTAGRDVRGFVVAVFVLKSRKGYSLHSRTNMDACILCSSISVMSEAAMPHS